ncbi:MAG: reverse transcriptase family protein, partial [Pseudomonadota bacterium]
LLIGGDFNRISLQELIIDTGLSVLDSPPTRGEARLDLLLTNKPELINRVSTFEASAGSDHLGLIASPKYKLPPVRRLQHFRYFSHHGHKKLNDSLSHLDFSSLYNITDPNEAAEWLEMSIGQCFTNSFPIKRVCMSNRDPSWITPKIKWLINKKKLAIRRHQYTKAEQYDKRIKTARIDSLKQHGTKAWWDSIDAMTHRKHDKNKLVDHAFTPDQLNKDLATRCALKTNETRETPPRFQLEGHEIPNLSLHEVANAIRKCKKTSSGPSNIPYFLFKDYWDILAQHYHYVWNLSLENGTFPRCYKRADVIPIPKVKNAKRLEDVRGVSITSIAARLFEKLVHQRWITPNIIELGDPHQFAYKPGLSTSDCLLTLQHFILSSLDLPEVDGVHAAMIDYSKAFDRVNQEKAATLQRLFIKSPFIQKWLYDFSIERQQRLNWNGSLSRFLPVDRGCSQGTVGGPGIFSMYTDDVRAMNNTSAIFKYSDDTTCLTRCMKVPSLNDKNVFSSEIMYLIEKTKNRDLDVNVKKSKHIRFCLNKHPFCQCHNEEEKLETVDDVKILGIIF